MAQKQNYKKKRKGSNDVDIWQKAEAGNGVGNGADVEALANNAAAINQANVQIVDKKKKKKKKKKPL
jgi:hypothetical protein